MTQFCRSYISIICSDDPLLRKEAVQDRLNFCRDQCQQAHGEAAEFLLFTHSDFKQAGSTTTNLKQLESEMSDPGLFGGFRLIKINLSDADNTAADVLTTLATNFRDGLYVVVEMPQVKTAFLAPKNKPADPAPLRRMLNFADATSGKDTKAKAKKVRRGKDAKLLEAFSYLLFLNAEIKVLYALDPQQVRPWIKERAHRYNLDLTPEALEFIANCSDNNLLTIDQSLNVLGMTYPRMRLGIEQVELYFNQDSRYTGLELPIAICQKDSLKALNIINSVCTSAGSSMADGLRLLIRRMDETINIIYEGQSLNVPRMSTGEQTAFFASRSVLFIAAKNAYNRAFREWTPPMLRQASLCLSEASQAYSSFDFEGAYRAMQRLAMIPVTGNSQRLKYLSTQPEMF